VSGVEGVKREDYDDGDAGIGAASAMRAKKPFTAKVAKDRPRNARRNSCRGLRVFDRGLRVCRIEGVGLPDGGLLAAAAL